MKQIFLNLPQVFQETCFSYGLVRHNVVVLKSEFVY